MGQTRRFEKIGRDQITQRAGAEIKKRRTCLRRGFGVAGAHLSRRSESEGGTPNAESQAAFLRKFDPAEGGSAAPSGDAKLGAEGALLLTSSKGLLDPPTDL